MFLQHIEHRSIEQANIRDIHPHKEDPKTLSQALTQKASDMQVVTPYKTIKRGEPPIRPEPTTLTSSMEPQRKWSIIHALARAVIVEMQLSRPFLLMVDFMLV